MRNRLRNLAVALVAVAVAGGASACTSHTDLPSGVFSGSDAADAAVVVNISTGSVKVNNRKGSWTRDGDIAVGRGASTTTLRCRMHGNDEMRCAVHSPARSETIDLMRL